MTAPSPSSSTDGTLPLSANPAGIGRLATDSASASWQDIAACFADGDAESAMPVAVAKLNQLRTSLTADAWRAFGNSEEFAPVRAVLHLDPYTRRGFLKPRGYPGDAVLLDYIYGCAPLPEETPAPGRAVYEWCSLRSDAFAAVRDRRRRLARLLDDTAERTPGARALAVACGHLREAHLSAAVVGRRLGELVALDQDPASLAVVNGTMGDLPVTPVTAGVSDILKERVELGLFDLIYAAGLYDYLPQPLASRLTAALTGMLRPGGRLVVANFVHCWEAGYMEAAMDWHLLYRDEASIRAFAGDRRAAEATFELDATGVIGYLTIAR